MARIGSTSQSTTKQYMQHVLFAAVFVLTQIVVGYHHVSEDHADDHDEFGIECDICLIAATISGSPDPSTIPDVSLEISNELPFDGSKVASETIARPGGPRAPPQTL